MEMMLKLPMTTQKEIGEAFEIPLHVKQTIIEGHFENTKIKIIRTKLLK